MPVFPSQDLYGKKICETYQQLLQVYDNDVVLDGSGSQRQFLNITASYALNCNCASSSIYPSVSGSFISSSTWIFTHNLQTRPVIVQAYDNVYNQIIPSSIVLTNDNTAILTFPSLESGYAIATRSGLRTIISGSGGGGTNLITGSTYPITASWANNVISASYANNFGNSITQSFVNSATWNFTHSLGRREVIIQAYNSNYDQIIPSNIALLTANTARLTFPLPISGVAVGTRGGRTIIQGGGGTTLYTGSYYPITSSWALHTITASYALNGGTNIYTGSTYPITSSWALSASFALTASYIGDSIVGTFTSSSTWTFVHGLEARPVLIQAYDINYNQIVPQDIVLTNDNTAVLTFPISESGFAIATRCGYRKVVTGTPMYTGSYYPITSSWAINTKTSSYMQVTGVTYPVKRIYNNYTVVRITDYTILCDATNGEFNVKLPNPVGNTNIYNIKKIDTSGHRINVTVTNASLIDYDLTQSIAHRGTNMTVQSDGTNQYWIL